ncbi:hypothetical protein TBLA_0B03430 [Henningerozyma blattae CBS 6284]|uniref:Protein FMP42 n=1 Tax=Henningerozyma blattae (strain ATCC 34711 / CBS 6284 / DSM 70876 / NBRC 10599 / NRRL Y-10934 / UCD 77-7) TaxID=1071380 RepID=I2GYI2_HENB6|nr:hypothetical protein TBLA_0B03430 [Tetrapisispora blattae CBS 6284]CCH59184.1 hypothetical protein TBLA_0B03430 [Tetrapisispora blattae CBS 6284]
MHKILTIACAALWSLFSSGIIFGFAAFKPTLIQQGIYSELCDDTSILNIPIESCVAQDLKLNKMFATAAAATNAMALPVGYILDHYGPSIAALHGAFFLILSSLCFIFHQTISWVDPYFIGYICLALGGPFLFISTFHLANIYPARSGSILALLTGTFDSSSALFLIYRLLYQNVLPTFTISKFFTVYLVVPIFIIFVQFTIMPWKAIKSVGTTAKVAIEGLDEHGMPISTSDIEDELENDSTPLLTDSTVSPYQPDLVDENTTAGQSSSPGENRPMKSKKCMSRRKSTVEINIEERLQAETGGLFAIMDEKTITEQIYSPWFYMMLIFASILMLRINYYVATVYSQELYLLGDAKLASKFNAIFDIALPLGGIVAIPVVGMILDNLTTLHSLVTLFIVSIIVSILGLIKNAYTANMLGMLILVVYRPFYYTMVSDYTMKTFGFDTFGMVYGLLTCVCGIFNMLQSQLDYWTQTKFNMNPSPINIILLLATAVSGFILISFLHIKLSQVKLEGTSDDDEEQFV